MENFCEAEMHLNQQTVVHVGPLPGVYRVVPKTSHTCFSGNHVSSYETLQPVLVNMAVEAGDNLYQCEDPQNGWRQEVTFKSPPSEPHGQGPISASRLAVIDGAGHLSGEFAAAIQQIATSWDQAGPPLSVLLLQENFTDSSAPRS